MVVVGCEGVGGGDRVVPFLVEGGEGVGVVRAVEEAVDVVLEDLWGGLVLYDRVGVWKTYFSYDKPSEDVLCYRPGHWECGGNLHGTAHVEHLGEEELDKHLYPDG